MEISVQMTQNPGQKPNEDHLPFGKYFTDHMFIMDYETGKGWYNPRIVPLQNLQMHPATMVLHYGQAIFEGLKAYRTDDGNILLFRPEKNMERINHSNERMCIPTIDVDFCVEATKKLVDVERDWVPTAEGTSLYIRPFIISTDVHLGVRPSDTYQFIIICSPSGAYYPEGLDPVKIFVENKYVRAVKGGVGQAKTLANYSSSLKAQKESKERGYTQVLWLDGIEKKYVEEVGTMNIFFVIDGEVITPALEGSILPGITRMSCIELLKSKGYKVTERRIAIAEVFEAHKNGKLDEVFGTGTAAVISPVGELNWDEHIIQINDGKTGPISQMLFDTVTGIQGGKIKDELNWTVKVG